jgi:hypothetical protein
MHGVLGILIRRPQAAKGRLFPGRPAFWFGYAVFAI